jgi:hypothetical protein
MTPQLRQAFCLFFGGSRRYENRNLYPSLAEQQASMYPGCHPGSQSQIMQVLRTNTIEQGDGSQEFLAALIKFILRAY